MAYSIIALQGHAGAARLPGQKPRPASRSALGISRGTYPCSRPQRRACTAAPLAPDSDAIEGLRRHQQADAVRKTMNRSVDKLRQCYRLSLSFCVPPSSMRRAPGTGATSGRPRPRASAYGRIYLSTYLSILCTHACTHKCNIFKPC